MQEKVDDAHDDSIEAVFLSILRHKDLDMRDKKAAIVDFIAAGIHTVRTPCHIFHALRLAKVSRVVDDFIASKDFAESITYLREKRDGGKWWMTNTWITLGFVVVDQRNTTNFCKAPKYMSLRSRKRGHKRNSVFK